ncbi:MAG: stage 0 sporulation family protein [Gemmatimonadales bacterium]
MPQLVEVRFKGNRKAYFTSEEELDFSIGDSVVVEVERGRDLGLVSAVGATAERKCGVGCDGCALGERREPTGKVLRQASSDDAHLSAELRRTEEDVRRKVMDRVKVHGLPMKVSDAEWQWDRKKLTIFFTADRRVDFRALVRDLAGLFRTRIELRQIGARDEAKRLDGIGRCGRQYCCSSWLPELQPVSLSLAKDQQLSLNPTQISGGCGRLLCCLRYEHEFYVTSRKRFPKEGRKLRTSRGEETVRAVDIFRDRVLLEGEDRSTRTVTLEGLRGEVAAAGEGRATAEVVPPADLTTFEEATMALTTEEAVEAVRLGRKRKRRRRRRRHPNRRPDGGEAGSGDSEGDGGNRSDR